MPSRSKLLRAQSVLIRRLCRLAKLCLDQNSEYRSQNVGGRPAACVLSDGGCFLVDKSGGVGLDDWEVKIADFSVRWPKMRKRFVVPHIELKACGK